MTNINKRRFLLLVFSLMLAGILSSCDPSSRPYLTVNRIAIFDGTPYVHVSENQSWGPGCCFLNEDHYFFSRDDGKTWEETSSIPVEMTPITEPEKAQRTACVPNDEKICYRIVGKEQVEISQDGGQTWKVDWEVPLGRKKYLERSPELFPFVRVEPDTIPFDLDIIATGNSHVVIVAMGNQGVLVKSSSGTWERYAIPSLTQYSRLATPLPIYASTLKDATEALDLERGSAFVSTFLFFVFISFATWSNLSKSVDPVHRREFQHSYRPFFISLAGFLGFFLLLIANLFVDVLQNSWLGEILFGFLSAPSLFICLVPIIGLIISWLFVIKILPNQSSGSLVALASLGYTFAFGVGIYIPFLLWAFGTISVYENALALSGFLGLSLAILGFYHVKRLSLQAIVR